MPLDDTGHYDPTAPNFEIAQQFVPFLTEKKRYKIAYGGRGGAKSWSIARILIMIAVRQPNHLILCAREFQSSIAESVHSLLSNQIAAMGLWKYFYITDKEIVCRTTGSRFIFKGLRRNIAEIKSLEGVTICWIEEAQAVSLNSWLTLIPTIRAKGSEIWISFNPVDEEDPTYQRFVVKDVPQAIRFKINWDQNPWFTRALNTERRHMLKTDQDAYDWIWDGHTRHVSEATIFRGRFVVEDFDTPKDARFMYGADWGFATDPTALVRCWVEHRGGIGKDVLYIDQEAVGYGVELDDLQYLFGGGTAQKNGVLYPGVDGSRDWPIKGDNSRPETISFVKRMGFNVKPAEKWEGCVEDGIAYLKAYAKIVIHSRCKHMAQEARLYSYKVDKQTNDILPKIEDKHNHCWDAVRYAHDGLITRGGSMGTWQKIARQLGK